MSTFVLDTFTDSNGVTLADHVAENANWKDDSNLDPTQLLMDGAGNVYSNTTSERSAFADNAPLTPAFGEFKIEATDVIFDSATPSSTQRFGLSIVSLDGFAYAPVWVQIRRTTGGSFLYTVNLDDDSFNHDGSGDLTCPVSLNTLFDFRIEISSDWNTVDVYFDDVLDSTLSRSNSSVSNITNTYYPGFVIDRSSSGVIPPQFAGFRAFNGVDSGPEGFAQGTSTATAVSAPPMVGSSTGTSTVSGISPTFTGTRQFLNLAYMLERLASREVEVVFAAQAAREVEITIGNDVPVSKENVVTFGMLDTLAREIVVDTRMDAVAAEIEVLFTMLRPLGRQYDLVFGNLLAVTREWVATFPLLDAVSNEHVLVLAMNAVQHEFVLPLPLYQQVKRQVDVAFGNLQSVSREFVVSNYMLDPVSHEHVVELPLNAVQAELEVACSLFAATQRQFDVVFGNLLRVESEINVTTRMLDSVAEEHVLALPLNQVSMEFIAPCSLFTSAARQFDVAFGNLLLVAKEFEAPTRMLDAVAAEHVLALPLNQVSVELLAPCSLFDATQRQFDIAFGNLLFVGKEFEATTRMLDSVAAEHVLELPLNHVSAEFIAPCSLFDAVKRQFDITLGNLLFVGREIEASTRMLDTVAAEHLLVSNLNQVSAELIAPCSLFDSVARQFDVSFGNLLAVTKEVEVTTRMLDDVGAEHVLALPLNQVSVEFVAPCSLFASTARQFDVAFGNLLAVQREVDVSTNMLDAVAHEHVITANLNAVGAEVVVSCSLFAAAARQFDIALGNLLAVQRELVVVTNMLDAVAREIEVASDVNQVAAELIAPFVMPNWIGRQYDITIGNILEVSRELELFYLMLDGVVIERTFASNMGVTGPVAKEFIVNWSMPAGTLNTTFTRPVIVQ